MGLVLASVASTLVASTTAGAIDSTVSHLPNIAGYDARTSAAFTTFSGSIPVPTVTCPVAPAGSVELIGVEVSLFASSGVDVRAGLSIECDGQSVSYDYAYVYTDTNSGSSSGFTPIEPGQVIRFSMRENPTKQTFTATVNNPADGVSQTATSAGTPAFGPVAADLSFCRLTQCSVFSPIPTFTPITFRSLTFGGETLAAMTQNRLKIEMYDGATLQAAPSRISAAGTFRIVFKHA